jgi:hypothetical protein
MSLLCAFCGFESITEGAHVQAKREENFPSWGHLFGNILRLCPNCHSLFDKPNMFITIHPDWRVFIISTQKKRRSNSGSVVLNPYYRLEYCYPHDDSLERILRDYILKNCNTEFRLRWATFELEMTYLKTSLENRGLWDLHNDKPVEQYIWYEMRTGPQRP